jgi:PST family polysaccharide transporter
MAATLTAFVAVLHGFGSSMAVVHADTVTDEKLQRLFRRLLWYALWLGVAMMVAAPLLSAVYDEPRLIAVIGVMTIASMVLSLADLPESLAMREMRFAALRKVEIGSIALGMVTGIVAARLGAGYWALVLQQVTINLCRATLAWRLVSWRPRRLPTASTPPRDEQTGAALRFAGHYASTNVVTYLAMNVDRVAIGVTAGPHAMGLYDNSIRWGLYPVHQLYPPLLNVAVAGLSRTRDDVERYRRYWSTALLLVMSAILPAIAFLIAESESVIRTLLGDRWIEAIPLFRLVVIGGLAVALTRHSRWIFLSEGRTRSLLRLSILSLALTIVTVLVGARWGIIGIATAYATARWLLLIPELSMAFSGSRIRWTDFFSVVWRPAVATSGAAAVVVMLDTFFPALQGARAITAGLTFSAIYVLLWLGLPGGRRAAQELAGLVRRVRSGVPS